MKVVTEHKLMTSSTIDHWERGALEAIRELQAQVQNGAAFCREHLQGVDRLLRDAQLVADHERIAGLTQALGNMRVRAETAEEKLAQLRGILNKDED